jgi:hypothetical protein
MRGICPLERTRDAVQRSGKAWPAQRRDRFRRIGLPLLLPAGEIGERRVRCERWYRDTRSLEADSGKQKE